MGPGRNTVLGSVAMTVVLGTAALVAMATTDDVAPASPTSTTAGGPNHPPVLTAPADRSRFDVEPGRSTTLVIEAWDPDRDVVRVVTRFTDGAGATIPHPTYVTCAPDADAGPSVRLRCQVAPKADAIVFMDVRAVDDRGASTPSRRYLVSGSPRTYVALGDSYAAGEGVPPFFDGDGCHRSTQSYATVVRLPGDDRPMSEVSASTSDDGNVRRHGTRAWSFWACSGADTSDIASQLEHPDVGPGADVVTVSVGGNDVGFAEVLNRCGAPPFRDNHCLDEEVDGAPFMTGLRARIGTLRPKLVRVYDAIRQRTFGAKLLVVGYPQLFPATSAEQECFGLRVFDFSTAEQDALRTLDRELDATIRSAAEEAGATYVDTSSVFAGHEVCGSAGEWINGVSGTIATWPPVADESFHPKRAGQAAMAAAINGALAR